MLSVPDEEARDARAFVPLLSTPFTSDTRIERNGIKYGWPAEKGAISAIAPPAFWTAMSLAVALRTNVFPTEDAKAKALEDRADVEGVLSLHHPDDGGGRNLFPDQVDHLIRRTFDWVIGRFNNRGQPPGIVRRDGYEATTPEAFYRRTVLLLNAPLRISSSRAATK